jgi:hypothetical protein
MAAARPVPINTPTTQLRATKLNIAIPGGAHALWISSDCLFFYAFLFMLNAKVAADFSKRPKTV